MKFAFIGAGFFAFSGALAAGRGVYEAVNGNAIEAGIFASMAVFAVMGAVLVAFYQVASR